MKYGKTERISGIVILLALAAILIPWLMSDPAPREERPQPSFTIEQPIDAPRHDVAEPVPPESIDLSSSSDVASSDDEALPQQTDDSSQVQTPINQDAAVTDSAGNEPEDEASAQTQSQDSAPQVEDDPIAALMAQADSQRRAAEEAVPATSERGEWGVQVGTFGNPDNAARLKRQLEENGFDVYTRERSDDLTTVIVGPFASSADGERASTLIKERVNQQGLLVRVGD
ncbi:SPOR domain-containing protein [Halomonas vilamensis]|uniref:SPOR domain-containing protein n=1 Tax=Vreelandella vilamensis TaxID=531309 RepID=A0ABU1H7F8_9GAMM|nr:SPOR domain-containing protein [Halomonas vilamensis]MDR5900226.1 SPOR domain-containing protein [Halomonas vilamensis]